jgi:putative ABC transport system permease protein
MFKNYFKTAFRNLLKSKTFFAINIIGLTIGLTSCLLIVLYIQHELSYDEFEQKGDRIARVIMEYSFNGSPESNKGNYTSIRVGHVLKKNFPEVEASAIMVKEERVVRYKEQMIDEKNFAFGDHGFFEMFSFPLLQGNAAEALKAPYQVILTQSMVKKYFEHENPIGKAIKVGTDSNLYQVIGVMADCPSNSQIKFDFLASFASLGLGKENEDSYWDANYTTYVLLRNPGSIASLQSKLPAFMKKETKGMGATINLYLEPFRSIHLHSPYGGFEANNNILYIYILGAVALLILVIACSTYINLSTARSMERAKEVGVRKVVGAAKHQLFWQFIGESALICFMAIILSFFIAYLLLPGFSNLADKQLQAIRLMSPTFIFLSAGIFVALCFIAGAYPAFILTRFQPVKVLKGAFKNSASGQWLRKSLIVFQFSISVFLIVSTIMIQKQLNYIQQMKLGYDRDHVLVMKMEQSMISRMNFVRAELKSNPDILFVSRCHRSPVEGAGGYNMRRADMPSTEQIAVYANPVDEEYLRTTGIQLIAGSDLTEKDISDVAGEDQSKKIYHFILNESAARQLGWTPEEAVSKKMFLDDSRPGFVRGVVRDFHFQSVHNPIRPIILFPEDWSRELLIKVSGQNLPKTIAFIETKWKTLAPNRPFEYKFLDEDYNNQYRSEHRLGSIMNISSSIAMILACFGLFGLSAYAAQQRIKEMGIRKVLGASLGQIALVLSKDFIRLVIFSLLIAFPLAWLAIGKWLQDFAYKTNISWLSFALAAVVAIALSIATISYQALKAGLANPVKSLRTE